MRALTVRQPWAWAIVHGGKDVENRSRNVARSYRGPVAIHAGLTFEDDALEDPALQAALPRDGHAAQFAFVDRHVLGAFVGVVDLVDVHKGWEAEYEYGALPCCSSDWAEPERWHLVLANPRPLPTPIPARGMLGLWTPPPVVPEQLQAVV